MNTLKLTIPKPHAAGEQIIREAKRFNVLSCGRRFGKTMLGLNRLSRYLEHPVAWFSPIYRDMLPAWKEAVRVFRPIAKTINAAEHRIELITGGTLEFWSLDNPNAGRSRKYKLIVIDEAAHAPNLQESWEQAIRATLTDYQGTAWFLSTPKGRNYFWRLYQRGIGEDPEWKSWNFPTSANPYMAPTEIEAAKQDLPELIFQQEYLAKFIESEGTVFRNIDACILQDTKDHAGHDIIFGVDWGKQNDFTAISVGCMTCNQEVDIDRFNKIDYSFQRGRLKVLADKWNPTKILAEQNSIGDPIIDQLQREGLPIEPFLTTAVSKPKLIENLALILEREEWHFLPDPVWRAELEAYERTVSPTTGRSSYNSPQGLHDDTVIARALMTWQSTNNNWYML